MPTKGKSSQRKQKLFFFMRIQRKLDSWRKTLPVITSSSSNYKRTILVMGSEWPPTRLPVILSAALCFIRFRLIASNPILYVNVDIVGRAPTIYARPPATRAASLARYKGPA